MKNTTIQLFSLCTIMFLIVVSCTHDASDYPVVDSGNGNNPPLDTLPCDSTNVSYVGTILPIFEAHCISCHAPPTPDAGIDLTNFETVAFIAQNGSLIGAIRHREGYNPMPANGLPLTECEILKIEKWIGDTTFTPGGSSGIPYDPDTVYFQNEVLPLLLSSCGISGCHDQATAEDDVILTSYYFVMQTAEVVPFEPWENDIIEKVYETDPDDRMPPPPAPPLTQDQKDMIYTWIQQGALNNHFDVEDCDSVNVTFAGMVFPIIQNSCFGCHSGTAPEGGIHLTNYSQIAAVGAIPPGNPGSLLGAVTWATGNIPMPKNGPHLSNCDIAQIREWINDGMPDN
jgi:mono/diheme cytochrome c family protein